MIVCNASEIVFFWIRNRYRHRYDTGDRIYRAAVAMLGRAEYLRYLVVGLLVKINAAADEFPQDRIKRDFLGIHGLTEG